ncbi:MAG: hypothetical protein AABX89_06610 [Candidatus Thermoplasmatota archaeon]
MSQRIVAALVLLSVAFVTFLLALSFRATAAEADAACAVAESCYVSPGIGDAVAASQAFVWAGVFGTSGLAVLIWAVLAKPKASAPPA